MDVLRDLLALQAAVLDTVFLLLVGFIVVSTSSHP